ncbi:MAG: DUF998 domain-containing protein [Candidatus Heimdallarchaeota archaeon]
MTAIVIILAVLGMISPIIYTIMWVIGGIIVPEYSSMHKDVSSLMAVGAYKRRLFQSLMVVSSIFMLAFYCGIHWSVNNGEGSLVGPILFIISSFMGVLLPLFFPLDEGGEPTTWRGKGHIIFVVLMGIIQITAMIFMYVRLRLVEGWQDFAIINLVSAILALVLVVIMSFFGGKKYMGLVERIMVSEYQIYYFVTALLILLKN